jgi:excisionase family DNA binding protein
MPEVIAPLRLALTMDEAAAALGCSRRSMYRLVAHGEIEAVKVGSLTRVPIAVLENYLTSKLTPPPHVPPAPAPKAPAQWRGRGGRRG